MTDDQIHDLIYADATAKALADHGDDAGAAARAATIVQPEVYRRYVTDRDIVAAFDDPSAGSTVLTQFAAAAAANPLYARVVGWLSPSEGGVDMGANSTRAAMDALAAAGVISTAAAAAVKGLAERPQSITPEQVSRAWLRHRPNGKVT